MTLVQRRERRWRQDQLDLAMTIAAQVALAVDTARHYQAAQQRTAEVETLATIGETLTSTLDLQQVLEVIVDSAVTLTGGQRAVVFELDQAGGCLRARAIRGIDMEPGFALPLGQGAAGAAAARLAPVWSADVLALPPPGFDDTLEASAMSLDELGRRHNFRGVLGVPVISRETALGAVCVYWDEVHEPDEREIRLLSALARQAAIALDNARLVGDLRRTLDDLRAAQETLVRGATLRAVGELAAGAAHHLNNLLAVVLGRTQLLLMKNPDAPTATSLRSIERAATDAAETVVRIQGFTRTAKRSETVSFDLNAAVQDAIEFTRLRWQDEAQVKGAPIDVAFEQGSPPAISGRSAEIREVMTNLILNAVDALPAGGRIAVRTRGEPGRAVVSVSDSGIGMSGDVKRRVFEPFFTTKGVKRTGLGLAVAYGTIRRHGGQVEVESEEGRGTTVTFWLPVDGPPSGGPSLERVGSILIIDDEADVRELVADVLAGLGHSVTVAGGGREGLARFETGRYDLVLTDLGMPDFNGWDVARAVKASRPDVPVLLLTGWADAANPADVPRVEGIIKKPFDLKQLAAAVSQALAASGRGPPIRAHLLRWRPRPGAQRRATTPRARPSGAASQLDPSRRPGRVRFDALLAGPRRDADQDAGLPREALSDIAAHEERDHEPVLPPVVAEQGVLEVGAIVHPFGAALERRAVLGADVHGDAAAVPDAPCLQAVPLRREVHVPVARPEPGRDGAGLARPAIRRHVHVSRVVKGARHLGVERRDPGRCLLAPR